ncbi:MAG: hypothetical protein ABSC18_10685 [Verrucomicrobiota bacterium]|jgi:hypothetical protein
MVMLLQKTVRSIQPHLHAFFAAPTLAGQSASASSWCEARLKLKHTAFIELNERAILDVVCGGKHDFAVRLWQGHRLPGMGSSLIRLPNELALGEEFGWVECTNQEGSSGRYPQARLSALTDVLNRIVLEAQLGRASEERKNPAQVNHAVSFHALKSQIIALLLSDKPISDVLPKLQRLFLDNPASSSPGRRVPRQKQSAWHYYHCQRNTRKSVFRIP